MKVLAISLMKVLACARDLDRDLREPLPVVIAGAEDVLQVEDATCQYH